MMSSGPGIAHQNDVTYEVRYQVSEAVAGTRREQRISVCGIGSAGID